MEAEATKESRIFVDQDRIRTSLLARLLWIVFYVTTRALKHHGRNAILLDPTSYSSVTTDAATHVLMNVFARNRNTCPPFSHARKELEKEHFIFSLNEQLSNVTNGKNGEGKNHNFLRKKKNKKNISSWAKFYLF